MLENSQMTMMASRVKESAPSDAKFNSLSIDFYGCFGSIRSRLDYTYHPQYSRERQLLQDRIIESFLSKGGRRRQTTPTPTPTAVDDSWAIYTAGAMGVGKTFVLAELERQGLLSLDDFVQVDPDALRECLPEYPTFLKQNPQTAGFRTQKEAGLMAEILTYAALELGISIIVDGSLRDSAWYESHFQELRSQYPKLCLSIFFITAPLEDIYQRVLQRSIGESGRHVPMSVLEDSLNRVPLSVIKLQKYVDLLVEIHNASKIGVEILRVET